MRRTWLAVLWLLVATPAWAQTTLTVEHFRPQFDGKGMYVAEGADSLKQWELHLGTFFSFGRDPLRVATGNFKGQVWVAERATLDFILSLGLTDWLEFGVNFPVVVLNDTVLSRTFVQSQLGPGMARFQLKLRLLSEKSHGLGLAFLARLGAPMTSNGGFLTENGATLSPMLAVEKRIGVARVLLNLGYMARKEAAFRDIKVDDEFFWRFGLGFQLSKAVEMAVELNGATRAADLFGQEKYTPAELLLGARINLGRGAVLTLGFGPGLSLGYGTPVGRAFAGLTVTPQVKDTDGDGIPDSDDKCPRKAGPRANGGCPWPDTDGDGVTDNLDKCPKVAGPKENNGCPWPDSDNDGVPDKDDACPKVAGPKANRGCPWPDTDKDGVLDKDDKCPKVAGPKENGGCPWPDTDKDGLLDKDDKCPKVAGPKENNGCPWPDTDKDGVLDKDDKCPKVAGPKENNGCPWPDTDGDGVLDKDDECPKQPGAKDNKGCPKKGVKVTRTEVRIDQQVRFRTGSSRIQRRSYRILNAVAKVLNRFKNIKKVEVQGHTDDVGSARNNRRLSQRRAKSVVRYLIRKKVDKGRLVPKGYGEDKPLVEVDRKKMSRKQIRAARAKNRRVQFLILEKE